MRKIMAVGRSLRLARALGYDPRLAWLGMAVHLRCGVTVYPACGAMPRAHSETRSG